MRMAIRRPLLCSVNPTKIVELEPLLFCLLNRSNADKHRKNICYWVRCLNPYKSSIAIKIMFTILRIQIKTRNACFGCKSVGQFETMF